MSTASNIWTKTPSFVKWLLLVAVLLAAAFEAGRYSKPDVVTVRTETVAVRDEVYTQQKIAEYVSTHKDLFTVTKVIDRKVAVPCPTPPPPADGCKSPCATDCSKCSYQIIEEHEVYTENHDSTTTINEHTTTNTTDVTHEAIHTATTASTINNAQPDWRIGVGALVKPDLKVDFSKAQISVTVERRLFWGFSAGVQAIPQSNLYGVSISRGF